MGSGKAHPFLKYNENTMLTIVSSAAAREFSSTQINAPDAIARKVKSWGKENIPDSDLYDEEPGFGRESNVHITVKFGLHTDSPEEVEKVVTGFGRFKVKLGEISQFEGEKYDVLKIDVESARLHELNGLIADSVECTDTFPVYKPHMTIAYVKKGKGKKFLGKTIFAGETWTADTLMFSSKNSKHTSIELS